MSVDFWLKCNSYKALEVYWTFCPTILCFDNPLNEALSLLPVLMLVHTLDDTNSANLTVLPTLLTHQDLLDYVLIQHSLFNRNVLLARLWVPTNVKYTSRVVIRVLTFGMELICFVERANISLPKCSTSPTCHLDGSLERKQRLYHQRCTNVWVKIKHHRSLHLKGIYGVTGYHPLIGTKTVQFSDCACRCSSACDRWTMSWRRPGPDGTTFDEGHKERSTFIT